MKVHAATIEHKHGTDLYLASTATQLEREIAGYVAQWWTKEMGGEMPGDEVDAILQYFDYMADRGEFLTRFGEMEVN